MSVPNFILGATLNSYSYEMLHIMITAYVDMICVWEILEDEKSCVSFSSN